MSAGNYLKVTKINWEIKMDDISASNKIFRKFLQNKIVLLNIIIEPGFKFGTVSKEADPKEFFTATVLNKIYSLNVSIENILLANDVFLSIYLYRYAYELYIKVFYIFSGSTDIVILNRLNNFFIDKKITIENLQQGINDKFLPPGFKINHKEKYEKICRFVHPNLDSLKLHINTTSDKQFDFLVPNITLTMWHIIEIVKLFSDLKILNLNENIDQNKLRLLWSQIHEF